MKGAWIARESSKAWPLPIDSDEDTTNTEDISGENLFYTHGQQIKRLFEKIKSFKGGGWSAFIECQT